MGGAVQGNTKFRVTYINKSIHIGHDNYFTEKLAKYK